MIIQHNISALNAHRQLGANNTTVGKNLEKLSSGFRINRAGDDAAGLAISEKMRSQIKGLETAQKNAQDGISLVQTAEGALTEVHSMLNRMVELATQSSNGTYTDGDRQKIQDEVNALTEEIDRISEGTNFNGINLLDGSLAGAGSTGSNLTGASVVSFKSATTTAAAGDASATALAEETINIDGANIKVDWSKLSTADQAALNKNWGDATATAPSSADSKAAASIMEKAINSAIDASGLDVDHISVVASGADGAAKTFKFTSGSADKNSALDFGDASGLAGVASGAVAATPFGATASLSNAADMNGDFVMNIDGKDFAISTAGISTTGTGTAGTDLEAVLKTSIDAVITNYNAAVPADQALKAADFGVEVTSDGRLKVTNNSDAKISFSDIEGGSAAKAMGISTEGKTTGSGLTLQVGDTNDAFQKVTVAVESMSASSLGIANLNLKDGDVAGASIEKINAAIEKVSSQRGELGAVQNRLEHTINNLGVTTENMTAAESRIRDVDMAKEMMDFTKNNVLTQAAQAMLAQANQQPQGVLQLLR